VAERTLFDELRAPAILASVLVAQQATIAGKSPVSKVPRFITRNPDS
jgi:hypothetical protein